MGRTILAFYFGRENFEAANQQVRQLVAKLTPEQRAATNVTAIMRGLGNLKSFKISQGQSEKTVPLTALIGNFSGSITRLPVIDIEEKPLYIVHQSSIDRYLTADKSRQQTDLLHKFLDEQKKDGVEFGLDKGFVVVSKNTTLGEAKKKMESIKSCLDIFITESGSDKDPLLGWISNIRLAKYMET
jgi:hypothetical protein